MIRVKREEFIEARCKNLGAAVMAGMVAKLVGRSRDEIFNYIDREDMPSELEQQLAQVIFDNFEIE